jgi:hypothetical protein
MKSDTEKRREADKKYKKWEPAEDSDHHWKQRGFSDWAMGTGYDWFGTYRRQKKRKPDTIVDQNY